MGQLAFALSVDSIYIFLAYKNKVVVFNQRKWPFWARAVPQDAGSLSAIDGRNSSPCGLILINEIRLQNRVLLRADAVRFIS
jgi:hypothetical protein